MSKLTIEVEETDLEELFSLLAEINDLFHQPSNLSDPERMQQFAEKYYSSINRAYYQTVWNWLPEELRIRLSDE